MAEDGQDEMDMKRCQTVFEPPREFATNSLALVFFFATVSRGRPRVSA